MWQIAGAGALLVWMGVWGLGVLRVAARLEGQRARSGSAGRIVSVSLATAALLRLLAGAWAIVVIHGLLLDGTFAD